MTHTKRERICWSPVWSKEYQIWSKFFILENKWRCDSLNGFDDLMQEAYLTFKYVADSYPRVIDDKQLMALYKRAMVNKMHDRSCRKRRRKDTVEDAIPTDVYTVFSGRMGEVTNSGYLAALLDEAPEELKVTLALLANGELDAPDKPRKRFEPRPSLTERALNALKAKGFAINSDPIRGLKELLA